MYAWEWMNECSCTGKVKRGLESYLDCWSDGFGELLSRTNKIYQDDKQGIKEWGWCTCCRCPNYKRWPDLAQRRFKFFCVLNLSLGKAVLLREILGQLVNRWIRCSNSQIYILPPSQNSQPNFISYYLFWLGRQCRPVKSGSAALNWPLGSGGIYTLQARPTMVIFSTESLYSKTDRTKAHPSPPLLLLHPSS